MRTYIFTQKEREILETYVNSGIKLNGFSVLINRLKKAYSILEKDFELSKKALEKT